MTGSAGISLPRDWISRVLWAALLIAIAATPLLYAPAARNVFRLPKTLFFQGAMLVVGGSAGAWMLLRSETGRRLRERRTPILLASGAVLWTAIVSMAAVQPELARFAPLTVTAYAVLFTLTLVLARGIVLPLLALLLPAAVNAAIVVLQALRVWSPMLMPDEPGRLHVIGLLGNPDYIGVYLIVPCIAALAAAFAFRRYRLLFSALFALLLAGIFFAQSVTAIGAIAGTLVVFGLLVRSRVLRLTVAAMAAILVTAIVSYGPTRTRAFTMLDHLRQGQFSEFSSYRLPAFAVAVDMFRERPLLGVGPGGYEAKYMSYKIANDERYPEWISLGNANFGEVHNDHLQLLAEAGLPGYALFVAALALLASLSFRRRRDVEEERHAYVRLFSLPAAFAFAVITLAQFPLYLTECAATAVFAAGLAFAWSESADEQEVPA
jgi:putative inorganic carbon (HCO3(-)) transporter